MPGSRELANETTDFAPVDDPRWQVVERIVCSPCFQKSERLKSFLKYVAQQYILGHSERLTGHQIGQAVFAKGESYDQSEDNTVRIHARQLRLRLLEYFDTYGRDEPYVIEIPKGSYVPVFRAVTPKHDEKLEPAELAKVPAAPEIVVAKPKLDRKRLLPWALAAVFAVIALLLFVRGITKPVHALADSSYDRWPLSELTPHGEPAQVIVCDNAFALFQVAIGKKLRLSEYLNANYPANVVAQLSPIRDASIASVFDQLGRKQLTSFADSSTASMIIRRSPAAEWSVRPARDLKLREVQSGNYVLLGSSWSNPWVELYEPKLNFVMKNDTPLGVLNRHPQSGESTIYYSQGRTGNAGDDYATIAMIPNEEHGSVLIVQGTKEEGTEAAGRFISDPATARSLRDKLGLKSADMGHSWFEALLKTTTIAGASAQTEIVAVRRLAR